MEHEDVRRAVRGSHSGLDFDVGNYSRQMVAGLMQAQQNAAAPQSLSNRVRIMVRELEDNPDGLRGELLDQVYTKSGGSVGP